jgi:hypothetical protein
MENETNCVSTSVKQCHGLVFQCEQFHGRDSAREKQNSLATAVRTDRHSGSFPEIVFFFGRGYFYYEIFSIFIMA